MAEHASTEKVTITIDGTKYQIPAGTHSLKDIAGYTGLSAKLAKLTVSSAAPAQANSVTANGSYNFIGGEVFTSTIGV